MAEVSEATIQAVRDALPVISKPYADMAALAASRVIEAEIRTRLDREIEASRELQALAVEADDLEDALLHGVARLALVAFRTTLSDQEGPKSA